MASASRALASSFGASAAAAAPPPAAGAAAAAPPPPPDGTLASFELPSAIKALPGQTARDSADALDVLAAAELGQELVETVRVGVDAGRMSAAIGE